MDSKDKEDYENGEYWYKVVVMVPRKVGRGWLETFFENVTETGYDIQAHYDSLHPGRDWDIFCYGTPEKDDR